MAEPLRVRAGELEADEIVAATEAGDRVVVETEVLGSTHEVTLRHDGERYYCDTPTTLHTHETREEMLECVQAQGYARD